MYKIYLKEKAKSTWNFICNAIPVTPHATRCEKELIQVAQVKKCNFFTQTQNKVFYIHFNLENIFQSVTQDCIVDRAQRNERKL